MTSELDFNSSTALLLVVHELTPYRMHVLRRFRHELGFDRVVVALTCRHGGLAWDLPRDEDIEWHDVSGGSDILRQGHVSELACERAKGREVLQLVEQVRPAAVVVCGYGDAGHRVSIAGCAKRGVPVLLWADSNIASEPSRGLRRLAKHVLLPRLLRQCTAVLPWGTRGVQYFRKYGVAHERIFTVPAEPDYAMFGTVNETRVTCVRERLGLSPQRRHLVYVGRLASEKRVDLLLSAFFAVAPDRGEWDLLVVGDGPMRGSLEAQVPSGLSSRVRFAGALTDSADLAAAYRLGEIFVLPSDHEPWGIVVNEAAASGMPLVLSDVVGAGGDLLRHGENGLVFGRGDCCQLRGALARLTREANLREMGRRSREILQHWRTIADPVQGMRTALGSCGVAR